MGNDNDSFYEEIINFILFVYYKLIIFEEISNNLHWRKIMNEEIHVSEKNPIWELSNLLVVERLIGIKWVYKTKYKLNEKLITLK